MSVSLFVGKLPYWYRVNIGISPVLNEIYFWFFKDIPGILSHKFRLGQVSSDQVKSGHVRSGQVRSCQVLSGQVRSGKIRSGQVRSGQDRWVKVTSGQVRSWQGFSSRPLVLFYLTILNNGKNVMAINTSAEYILYLLYIQCIFKISLLDTV